MPPEACSRLPRTVRIDSGSPSLRRSCATCTSTVRVPPGYVMPHTRSSSFSRESTMPGMLEEAREQVELLARQLDLSAGDGDVARVAPQHDVARREHLVLVAVLDAAQDRLDARGELARRERLRDVVVGAELEAGDAVGLLVARGQHQDRHLRVRAHLPADLEAVDPRQADVEHDEPTGCRRSSATASSPERIQTTVQPSCCSR